MAGVFYNIEQWYDHGLLEVGTYNLLAWASTGASADFFPGDGKKFQGGWGGNVI
jgi:hypothetical protein